MVFAFSIEKKQHSVSPLIEGISEPILMRLYGKKYFPHNERNLQVRLVQFFSNRKRKATTLDFKLHLYFHLSKCYAKLS